MTPRECMAYPVLLALARSTPPPVARSRRSHPRSLVRPVPGRRSSLRWAARFPVGILIGFVVAAQGIKRGQSKAVLLASLALVAIGSLGFIIGDSPGSYFARRFFMGLGSGGVWIGITFGTPRAVAGVRVLVHERRVAALISAYRPPFTASRSSLLRTPAPATEVLRLTAIARRRGAEWAGPVPEGPYGPVES
jgi:hypothetical protein